MKKKNSHKKKASFRLFWVLLTLLAIGIMCGRKVMTAIIIYTVVFSVTILISGVAAVLICTIKEEIERKRSLKDKETLSD